MSEEIKKSTFTVTVDNITLEVAPGTTVLHAARLIGGVTSPPIM